MVIPLIAAIAGLVTAVASLLHTVKSNDAHQKRHAANAKAIADLQARVE